MVTDDVSQEPADSSLERVWQAAYARRTSPLGVWSRWATIPLRLVPAWTGQRWHTVAVSVWFAAGWALFPKPQTDDAWSTRAMLGQEKWGKDRPFDKAFAISTAAAGLGIAAVAAARLRRLMPALLATGGQMVLLIWYWDLMASYYEQDGTASSPTARPLSGDASHRPGA